MESTYECDCCGACCKTGGFVECDAVDTLRAPELLTPKLANGYCQQDLIDDPDKRILLVMNPCRFLDGDHRCTIYPQRPFDCVAALAGEDHCQGARAQQGLPPLEPVRRVQVEEVARVG